MRASFYHLACLSCLLLCTFTDARGSGVPFEFRDGLIWIKVRAQGSNAPLNFLLDSGAGSTVVSAGVAEKLGVQRGSSISAQRVGGSIAAYRAKHFQASLGGMALSDSPMVLDLSRTSSFCSRSIDGLVGQDFLRGRVVQINFKSSTLEFLERSIEVAGTMVLKLKTDNAAFCVSLSVNGSPAKWARLDTGCDDALHWVAGLQTPTASSVQLGAELIRNVKTAWHRTPIFPDEAGLLGNGVLSNYLVTIDAVKGRLLLKRV